MPSTRSTSRPGAGPGRGRARARSRTREPAAGPATPAEASVPAEAQHSTPADRPNARSSSITTRAIALAVVLLILTISYASSLRVYFAQAEKISATRADIVDRQARIAELRSELALWDDTAFVEQQARDRLGWVVPGEIGFRVIGPDGKPLGGGAEIGKAATVDPEAAAWWQRLKGSLEAADRPAPTAADTKPSQTPITEDTEPN